MKLLRDLWLFVKAWRIAAVKIADEKLSKYRPETRHLIVFNQVIDDLEVAGLKAEQITGCIVHAAVALCYRFKKS